VAQALEDETSRETVRSQMASGKLDLLSLPAYGRYQHTALANFVVKGGS
jgi:hypothetical protein